MPSVTRLTQKLGYATFRDFKMELAMEPTSPVADMYSEITPADTDAEMAKKVFYGSMRTLEDTLKILDF